jgi:hypothetical protein
MGTAQAQSALPRLPRRPASLGCPAFVPGRRNGVNRLRAGLGGLWAGHGAQEEPWESPSGTDTALGWLGNVDLPCCGGPLRGARHPAARLEPHPARHRSRHESCILRKHTNLHPQKCGTPEQPRSCPRPVHNTHAVHGACPECTCSLARRAGIPVLLSPHTPFLAVLPVPRKALTSSALSIHSADEGLFGVLVTGATSQVQEWWVTGSSDSNSKPLPRAGKGPPKWSLVPRSQQDPQEERVWERGAAATTCFLIQILTLTRTPPSQPCSSGGNQELELGRADWSVRGLRGLWGSVDGAKGCAGPGGDTLSGGLCKARVRSTGNKLLKLQRFSHLGMDSPLDAQFGAAVES